MIRSASAAGRSGRNAVIGDGGFAHVRGEHPLRRAIGEDDLAGEQLVRHRAERVDVGARVDVRIARRLLGRHVRGRADARADLRERRAARPPCATR